ncbi:MAG: hypothetical protein ACPGQL_05700 [Thermoplasmatota archaeon]
MRYTALATLLAALVLAASAPAAAQDAMNTDAAYLVRGALGDIPLTDATEAAGLWNVVEIRTFAHTEGNTTGILFTAPAGSTGANLGCDCNGPVSVDGVTFRLDVPADEPSGTYTATFSHSRPVDTDAWGFVFPRVPEAVRDDAAFRFYVPEGTLVAGPMDGTSLPSTAAHPGLTIFAFEGTAAAPVDETVWFSAYPESTQVAGPSDTGFDFMALAMGLILGAALWAVLVARGMVQARQRKQVVSAPTHKEVAQKESAKVLEGRKRLLMAALKDLELAKAKDELETEVYDALKADFKKQTVTVMRALEEARNA